MFWYNKTLVEFDLVQHQISFAGSSDATLSFASPNITCPGKNKSDVGLALIQQVFNPSFTKPFGTHTFYQEGGSSGPPSYLRNRCSLEGEILLGIRDTFESLRNVKVCLHSVYLVTLATPQRRGVLWENH